MLSIAVSPYAVNQMKGHVSMLQCSKESKPFVFILECSLLGTPAVGHKFMCVCVRARARARACVPADISLNCAKND